MSLKVDENLIIKLYDGSKVVYEVILFDNRKNTLLFSTIPDIIFLLHVFRWFINKNFNLPIYRWINSGRVPKITLKNKNKENEVVCEGKIDTYSLVEFKKQHTGIERYLKIESKKVKFIPCYLKDKKLEEKFIFKEIEKPYHFLILIPEFSVSYYLEILSRMKYT